MPRLRALFAILLVGTWCSAVWHCDLEAIGLMLDHEHHAPGEHHDHHDPVDPREDHTEIFAREVAKDQNRVGTVGGIWIAVLSFAVWLMAYRRPSLAALKPMRRRRETDPPFAQVWQFMWRCAPESAAPPALD
jgi:hypothetical protein